MRLRAPRPGSNRTQNDDSCFFIRRWAWRKSDYRDWCSKRFCLAARLEAAARGLGCFYLRADRRIADWVRYWRNGGIDCASAGAALGDSLGGSGVPLSLRSASISRGVERTRAFTRRERRVTDGVKSSIDSARFIAAESARLSRYRRTARWHWCTVRLAGERVVCRRGNVFVDHLVHRARVRCALASASVRERCLVESARCDRGDCDVVDRGGANRLQLKRQ